MSSFSTRYLADYQAADYAIEQVQLTFLLADHHTQVTNLMTIKAVKETNKPLVLDGEQLTLVSVHYNGNKLDEAQYIKDENQLVIHPKDQEFTLEIVTEIDPLNNTSLEGLFKSGDAFCTQCEAEGFRRITYYLDRPDVMAIFTTKVIADKTQYPYLLANGNKIEEGSYGDNQHFVTWHDPFPKPCYLFALVAGDFELLKDNYTTSSGRNVSLEIFVDKGNGYKAHHAMASLKKSMAWDEQTFGLEYDLDIYMIVAVDFFNMGAMENKGLNVFNSKFVLADDQGATDVDYFNVEAVIAHEYFHNWTGNRVTCRDWFQLSLKEGLTVFRDQQFSADMHSAPVTRIDNVRVLRSHQFAEDSGPMSHPIRPEKVMEMNNFYTLTVYEKGAEVIRMIHTLLGKAGFRKGMDLYFQRFDGMAVTCDDFVDAMADANNTDLSLFKRWYSQSGTPKLKVKQDFDANKGIFTLTISQHHIPSKNQQHKENLHIPIAIELIDSDTKQVTKQLLELKQESTSWQFEYQQQPVVAFLADFSAPVLVDFQQTIEQLTQVIEYAQDSFCRWDAFQKLMQHHIVQLTENDSYQIPESFIQAMLASLQGDDDNAFKALMLTLPSFDELVVLIDQVDPQRLNDALEQLKKHIGLHLSEPLLLTYQSLSQTPSSIAGAEIGNRSLMNVCLVYLAGLPQHQRLLVEQFNQSKNMTTTIAALNGASKQNIAEFDGLSSAFEDKWFDTRLVMDKWYSVQAIRQSDDIFLQLEQLMKREDFTLTNPNRARSLIGAFAMQNPRYFHCSTGRGYQFLADQVIALNGINPQVASRLITPLIQFKEFTSSHQNMMINELKRIRAIDNLSRDLSEKLDAALAE